MDKPKSRRFLAGCMLVLGLAAALGGLNGIRQWAAVAWATQVYYAVSLAMGLALVVCGAWGLASKLMSQRAAVGGLVAALALGVNQVVGLRFNTILCYSQG